MQTSTQRLKIIRHEEGENGTAGRGQYTPIRMATRAFQQLTIPGAGESVAQPAAPGPGRVVEAQPGSPTNGRPPKVCPEVPTLIPDIGSPRTSAAGMHKGAATSEKSWAAAYRAEHALTVTPGRPLPAIPPGEVKSIQT